MGPNNLRKNTMPMLKMLIALLLIFSVYKGISSFLEARQLEKIYERLLKPSSQDINIDLSKTGRYSHQIEATKETLYSHLILILSFKEPLSKVPITQIMSGFDSEINILFKNRAYHYTIPNKSDYIKDGDSCILTSLGGYNEIGKYTMEIDIRHPIAPEYAKNVQLKLTRYVSIAETKGRIAVNQIIAIIMALLAVILIFSLSRKFL